jgi:hypothetical protein
MILPSRINGNNAKCDNCDILFHRKMTRLKALTDHACSHECRWELDKKKNTTPCENCGKEFYREAGKRKNSKHHCCSKTCSNLLHTGKLHKRYNPDLRGRKCDYCKGVINNPAASKYCSHACKGKANSGENHVKFNQTTTNCFRCGTSITLVESALREKNFCGQSCKNAHHSEEMLASNNPRFKHGDWLGIVKPKLLYKGFTNKIKQQVRERDGNRCVICSIPKEEHGFNLHVHHIDYDKTNNELYNLVCVCRHCHGKIHGDEAAWYLKLAGSIAV